MTALESLTQAAPPATWRAAQGVFHQWRDTRLTDRAFAALRPSAQGTVSTASRSSDGDKHRYFEETWSFHIDDAGSAGTIEIVSRNPDAGVRPDKIVASSNWVVVTSGDRTDTSATDLGAIGGTEFIALLKPRNIGAGFVLTDTDERTTVAGRACTRLHAQPRRRDPYGHTPGTESLAMIDGGDSFWLSVDDVTSAILRAEKMVDGVVAELCEFTSVRFDT